MSSKLKEASLEWEQIDPTPQDKAYFEQQSWCRPLLTSSEYTPIPTFSRIPKASTEDSLIAETFKTPETISACLSFYKNPSDSTGGSINEIRRLMSLQQGVNGGVKVAHGGFLATLMDDAMGALIGAINMHEGRDPGQAEPGATSSRSVTAGLNVKFLKAVATPQDVEVIARLRERKGRKLYIDGEIRDKNGVLMASSEALWVVIKRPEGKL